MLNPSISLFRTDDDGKKDMRKVVNDSAIKFATEDYKLVSRVVHEGISTKSGHYVSFFTDVEPVLKYNDFGGRSKDASVVSALQTAKTDNGQSYIFLYKKIEKNRYNYIGPYRTLKDFLK